MKARPLFRQQALLLAAFCLLFAQDFSGNAHAGDATNAATPDISDVQRAFVRLQAQLVETQQTLERNRRQAEDLAARNADAVAAKLQAIELSFASQHARDLESLQGANRTLMLVVGVFVGLGFIAMLVTAWMQSRAINRLADFATMLPATGRMALPGGTAATMQLAGAATAEQSSTRLFGALSQLEKRILELEHTSAAAIPANGHRPVARFHELLEKGQEMLNREKAGEALACFEEILAIEPDHAEALVKKGVALEKQEKTSDALRCYDRAIELDGSLTIAYLQKGGLFNRMERFEEALRCYEQALRTQEKSRAA